MHVHLLGICGTFMAGLATLARSLGHDVSGSDRDAYPPMSEQLAAQGITIKRGYDAAHLDPRPDCVVIGNALSRGNPAVERVLNEGPSYQSGPEWLARHVLAGRRVVAVAGTHGKTTTTGMVIWILERAGRAPGYLVGGVAHDLPASAALGDASGGSPFVVEADEYDTAFFDKRSKFLHYHPEILVVTGIEFDHGDIFDDVADIRRQFHHLLRTVPSRGLIVRPSPHQEIDAVLEAGCWTAVEDFGLDAGRWRATLGTDDASRFQVQVDDRAAGEVAWALIGRHNVMNGLAAVAAASALGIDPSEACRHLSSFRGMRRRLEIRGKVNGVTIYDDFAHHPTAISATLQGLRARVGKDRIVAITEPASNTMRMGLLNDRLGDAFQSADQVWFYRPAGIEWEPETVVQPPKAVDFRVRDSIETIVREATADSRAGDHVVVMSNRSFGGIHGQLLAALRREHD